MRDYIALAAVRSETRRSFSLPDNKLPVTKPSPQQPNTSASSSVISSIEENYLRSPVDSGSTQPGVADRASVTADVKSPMCDIVMTPHDVTSPVRNFRPARLDMAAVQTLKADLSPDDRKTLFGILRSLSPRQPNTAPGFVVSSVICSLICMWQCGMYSVSQKIPPALQFSDIFSQTVGNF